MAGMRTVQQSDCYLSCRRAKSMADNGLSDTSEPD